MTLALFTSIYLIPVLISQSYKKKLEFDLFKILKMTFLFLSGACQEAVRKLNDYREAAGLKMLSLDKELCVQFRVKIL